MAEETLEDQLKALIVERLFLDIDPSEIEEVTMGGTLQSCLATIH